MHAALAPVGNDPDLVPGSVWTSPVAFFGCFTGDLDAAAAAQYDFHRAVLSPPLPADFPLVQYNTWYSYFCDLDHATLAEEVKIAADLGVEIFYLDAGWWVGSPKNNRRDLFTSGLGHWVENRDKFPEGSKRLHRSRSLPRPPRRYLGRAGAGRSAHRLVCLLEIGVDRNQRWSIRRA